MIQLQRGGAVQPGAVLLAGALTVGLLAMVLLPTIWLLRRAYRRERARKQGRPDV